MSEVFTSPDALTIEVFKVEEALLMLLLRLLETLTSEEFKLAETEVLDALLTALISLLSIADAEVRL